MARIIAALAVLAWLAPAAPASADVRLQISNGRVSLHATNASVRQILEEWARVGQTRIVNAENVPGGVVTLELENVPEAEALETILRSASGYLAAPRPTPAANLSRFDRIVVVPTSSGAVPSGAPVRNDAATMQRPGFQGGFPGRPPFPVGGASEVYTRPGFDDQSDDGTPITNVEMPNRGPVFNNFQQPQAVDPNDPNQGLPPGFLPREQQLPPGQLIPNPAPPTAQPPAGTYSTPFGGTAMPGVIVQPPQQQQQQQQAPPQGR